MSCVDVSELGNNAASGCQSRCRGARGSASFAPDKCGGKLMWIVLVTCTLQGFSQTVPHNATFEETRLWSHLFQRCIFSYLNPRSGDRQRKSNFPATECMESVVCGSILIVEMELVLVHELLQRAPRTFSIISPDSINMQQIQLTTRARRCRALRPKLLTIKQL